MLANSPNGIFRAIPVSRLSDASTVEHAIKNRVPEGQALQCTLESSVGTVKHRILHFVEFWKNLEKSGTFWEKIGKT